MNWRIGFAQCEILLRTMPELLHKELSSKILRAYYDVYNGTGRIYPERFYDRAMLYELGKEKLNCLYQPEWTITYKDKIVGKQILDILVAGDVVIEDKVLPGLTKLNKAQILSYLKVTDKQIGLLLNFGSEKPEFQRIYFARREVSVSKGQVERAANDETAKKLIEPQLVYDIVGGLFEVHTALGPGFIYRIYANACHHEFKLRGLPTQPHKLIQAFYEDFSLGELHLAHFRIGDSVMVFPHAVQHASDLGIDSIRSWLKNQGVALGIVANFYDTELKPIFVKANP